MDLATLGIRIDSSQAKTAAAELEKVAGAGAKAEKAVIGVGKAADSAASGIGKTADSTKQLNAAYNQGVGIGNSIRTGFIAVASAATAAAGAIGAATIALINQVGNFQDIGDKIGDTARNVSSLKEASDVSGVSMDTLGAASIRLTASLSKTDDESKLVAKGLTAIGISLKDFKTQSPVEQLESISRALEGFADGSEKTAAAQAIFGRSGAEVLPFLKEYADRGRDAAFVTAEQAKAADDFSDSLGRAKSQFVQFLQASAVQAIPVLSQIGDLFKTIAEEQNVAGLASGFLKSALGAAVVVFQTVAVVASEVGFVLLTAGRSIGAFAAQAVALARLDFSGFNAISKAVAEDTARARVELDKFQARVLKIGETAPAQEFSNEGRNRPAPRINVAGLSADRTPKPKKDNSAAQEARAQLALDLDAIRKASDALINTIGNAEKVLEAQRAAGLLDESAYYQKKREFIQINDALQESAIQREIDRLQSEKLSGKEKIENDRKILDAQAKLAKVREDASNSIEILGIREVAALKKTADAFTDARAAAQQYLEAIQRAQQAEIAGIGKGSEQRDFEAAKRQIEERYLAQRQSLAGEFRRGDINKEQYDQQLALIDEFQGKAIASYEDYYRELGKQQKDFTNGANEAIANYLDGAANLAKQTEELTTRALGGIEDAFVSLATTGKADFKGLVNSIIADIVRMQARAQAAGLANGLASLFSTTGSTGFSTNQTGTSLPTRGGAATGTNFVERDMLTILHKGEAVVPKAYNPAANMGAMGAGGSQVYLNIQGGPSTPKVTQRREGNKVTLDVIYEPIRDRLMGEVNNGGPFMSGLSAQTGVNRTAGLVR